MGACVSTQRGDDDSPASRAQRVQELYHASLQKERERQHLLQQKQRHLSGTGSDDSTLDSSPQLLSNAASVATVTDSQRLSPSLDTAEPMLYSQTELPQSHRTSNANPIDLSPLPIELRQSLPRSSSDVHLYGESQLSSTRIPTTRRRAKSSAATRVQPMAAPSSLMLRSISTPLQPTKLANPSINADVFDLRCTFTYQHNQQTCCIHALSATMTVYEVLHRILATRRYTLQQQYYRAIECNEIDTEDMMSQTIEEFYDISGWYPLNQQPLLVYQGVVMQLEHTLDHYKLSTQAVTPSTTISLVFAPL